MSAPRPFEGPDDPARGRRDLRRFFVGTFGITWGLALAYFLFPDFFAPAFLPLFFVAVYAPLTVSLWLTWRDGGLPALRSLLGRLLIWRVGRWWLLPLGLVPAAGLTAFAIGGPGLSFAIDHLTWTTPLAMFAAIPLALLTDPGPLGEEIGYRGYVLPRITRLLGWRGGALAFAVLWWLWHVPSFFISVATQSQLPMGWMVLQWFATSVIMAWMTLNTGSLLLAVLFHLMLNINGSVALGASPAYTGPLLALFAVGVLIFGKVPSAATAGPRHRHAPH